MKTINLKELGDYLQDHFINFAAENKEKYHDLLKEGTILIRELNGVPADNLEEKVVIPTFGMPLELMPLLIKIAHDTEDALAPDSRNMVTVANISNLAAALLTMSAMTARFLEIENNTSGLT
ncbi:hypothetical protein LCGC14_1189720 [marine sediment metagenome]|uniref:Uncharacterized protein n=1 Tax=marine sediment metagenome TaxID=412755 RepID=A0A0F9M7K2_9ZZZZ